MAGDRSAPLRTRAGASPIVVLTGLCGALTPGPLPPLLALIVVLGALGSLTRGLEAIPRSVILGAALWGLAVIASDLMHDSLSVQTVQSVARPLLIALTILFILGRPHPATMSRTMFPAFLVGLAITQPLMYGTTADTLAEYWKYHAGWSVTLTTLVLAEVWSSGKAKALTVVLPASALTSIHLLADARSLGALTVLSVIVGLSLPVWRRSRTRNRVLLLVGIPTAIGAAYAAYGQLASTGMLGHSQMVKWEIQSASPLGPIVAGRPELIVAAAAISEAPLWGHGTELMMPSEARSKAMRWLESSGLSAVPEDRHYYFRPDGAHLHSKIPSELAAHGILAGAGFSLILLSLWRTVMRTVFVRYSVACSATLLSLTWDVLFSPWSTGSTLAVGLASGLILSHRKQEYMNSKARPQGRRWVGLHQGMLRHTGILPNHGAVRES